MAGLRELEAALNETGVPKPYENTTHPINTARVYALFIARWCGLVE